MKNMHKFYLFLAIILIISCESKSNITISDKAVIRGTVLEYGTQELIAGVKVTTWQGFLSGPSLGSLHSTITDENGKFNMTIERDWPTFLEIYHKEYSLYSYSPGEISSPTKVYLRMPSNDEVFIMKPKAWFNATLTNTDIPDSTIIQGLDANLENTLYRTVMVGESSFSAAYNSDLGWTGTGNDYFRYKIEYKRDNLWHEIIDGVYLEKGTIFRDTIYY